MTNPPAPQRGSQRPRTSRLRAVCAALGLLAALPAAAQVRPLAIQDATVLTGDGRTIEHATIVIQGGKITAVGPAAEVPLLARRLPAHGRFVTPGLIDVHSTLGTAFSVAGGKATARAADAFNRYAQDDIRAALEQGVTAIYLPARGPAGIGGQGSVLRLRAGGTLEDIVLEGSAALSFVVSPDPQQGPLARVKAVQELRKALRAACDYREAWDEYKDNLKEYEEKLAERARKAEGDKAAKEKPGKGATDETETPVEAASASSDEPGTQDLKAEPKKKDERKDEKKDEARKDEQKPEELKKPGEPDKDRAAEELLRALDGELVFRAEADDPADILNLLEVAHEFNLALIIEGGAGAHLVAQRLAQQQVPVVLSGSAQAVAFAPTVRRWDVPDAAARLAQAGVDVYLGSGVVPSGEAPHLALRAARAVGHGLDGEAALKALTGGAARLLGVEQEIGRVAPGLRADLVVWSAHPLSPGARVERVYVDGREVWRPQRAGGGEEDDE